MAANSYTTATIALLSLALFSVSLFEASRTVASPSVESEDFSERQQLSVFLVSMELAGHSLPMVALGEELVRRGHKVTFLASEIAAAALHGSGDKATTNLRSLCKDKKIDFVSAGVHDMPLPTSPENKPSFFAMVGHLSELQHTMLDKVSAAEVSQAADVIVVDMLYPLVVHWLQRNTNLTIVSLTPGVPIYATTVPSYYYPVHPSNPVGPENPTFFDRLKSLFATNLVSLLSNTVLLPFNDLLPYHVANGVSVPDLVTTSFGFDYPRPQYPLTHYIGPLLLTATNDTLLGDLKTWMDSHPTPHNVVYLSMGSMFSLEPSVARGLIQGVIEEGYDLLWSLRGDRSILREFDDHLLSGRIFVSSWLPQTTVLKHVSVAMAVLHGGLGGVSETLSAGVPIICLPQAIDQLMNCARVKNQGFGVDLGQRSELTVSEARTAIQSVHSLQYRNKAQKISKIFKKAGGASKAVELIEYYHEVGYDHLVPAWAKYNWTFVQYYNLDVYCVVGVLVWIVVQAVRKAGKICRRKCARKTTKTD